MSEKAETVTTPAGMASLPPGPAARQAPRHRRPTGAPPPLPHPVSVTTRAWLVLAVVVLAGVIVISVRAPSLRLDNQVSTAVLRFFARARTPWLTDVANGIYTAGSGWGATVVGLSAVALTIVFRRWRHLLVFLCSLFAPRARHKVDHRGDDPAAAVRRADHRGLDGVFRAGARR